MQTKIKSFIKKGERHFYFNIFGYTTKGMPGIEIIGPTKFAKILKEKIIYLIRSMQLKTPTRRYVICIDETLELKNFELEEIHNLEFPILVVYLQLAELLKINKLDDCLCAGKLGVNGVIDSIPLYEFKEEFENYKYIGLDASEHYAVISADLLMSDFKLLSFRNYRKIS
jgi:hypothetical protein